MTKPLVNIVRCETGVVELPQLLSSLTLQQNSLGLRQVTFQFGRCRMAGNLQAPSHPYGAAVTMITSIVSFRQFLA